VGALGVVGDVTVMTVAVGAGVATLTPPELCTVIELEGYVVDTPFVGVGEAIVGTVWAATLEVIAMTDRKAADIQIHDRRFALPLDSTALMS